ncbi:MAG: hypothetical protein NXI09_12735 [Bacteroidetes bacterium]|nr:hypothetical protein [Bacteroidota bacterium]
MLRTFILLFLISGSLITKAQSTDFKPGHKPQVAVEMSESLRNVLYLYKAKSKKYPQIAGYRIQIFNGRRDDCLSKRSNFLRQFPNMKAYLLYEVPEYKTQVGNFRNRLEAEGFLQKIRSDFPGSFVISCQIDRPQI